MPRETKLNHKNMNKDVNTRLGFEHISFRMPDSSLSRYLNCDCTRLIVIIVTCLSLFVVLKQEIPQSDWYFHNNSPFP